MPEASLLFAFFQACLLHGAGPENCALHKKYTLAPQPNYGLCTDPDDTTQLTDGERRDSHWSRKSTVGWWWPDQIPQITIDLGQVCLVDRVKIHTAAGSAGGVKLYRYAAVLLSRNGVDYQLAGFGRAPEEARQVALREPKLHTVGAVLNINAEARFVKILIQQDGVYWFCDEIEVLGSAASGDVPHEFPVHVNSDYAVQTIHAVQKRLELMESISRTQQAMAAHGESFPPDRKNDVAGRLHLLAEACRETALSRISEPELKLAAGILGRIRASLYEAYYKSPLVLLPADHTKQLRQAELVLSRGGPQTALSLWRQEIGSVAFNVVNSTPQPLGLRISVSPLTADGRRVSPDEVFTLREAAFVHAVGVGQIADALVPLGHEGFTAEPGRVHQIWLKVDAAKLPAGAYSASLTVETAQAGRPLVQCSATMAITIHPINMAERLAFNAFNWSYIETSDVTRNSVGEAAGDLASHGINVITLLGRNLFPKNAAAAGRPLPQAAYAAMDKLIEANRHARMYLLILNLSAATKDGGAFGEWMTETWKRNFKSWLLQWVGHLKGKGIGYDRLAVNPYDEYIGEDFLEVARVIREADPRIRIFANSHGHGPEEFRRLRDLVDIWCFHQEASQEHLDWMREIQSFGKECWCYRPLSRTREPFEDYRKLPWWAFKHGLTGTGFWVYADTGKPRWHDYGKAVGNYGVVYGAYDSPMPVQGETIIPSRRWELWREGMQDGQYLAELQSRIARVRAVDPGRGERLQQQLRQWVDRVLLGGSTECIEVKKQITQTILELEALPD